MIRTEKHFILELMQWEDVYKLWQIYKKDKARRFLVNLRAFRPSRNPSFVSGKTGVLNRFWTKIEKI